MEIGSTGNLYTLAPGTSKSPVRPQANLTFEESNAAVDKALDTTQNLKNNRQEVQDTKRQAVVSVVEKQQQQNNVQRYVEASTKQQVESSNTFNVDDFQDLSRTLEINRIATAVDNKNNGERIESPERPENKPADALQSRIQELVGDRSNSQRSLDLFA